MSVADYQPLFIIGAARSGTNILRDTLCSLPGFHTWPCDEINPILMHGNLHQDSDVLTADDASVAVSRFMKRAFDREAKNGGNTEVLVEKTCSNSVRLPFLDAIFPEARYIWIVRDGRDAVSSSRKLWLEGTSLGYKLKKMRYIPISDFFHYLDEYFLQRLLSKRKTGAIHNWGVNVGDPAQYCSDFSDPFLRGAVAKWIACYQFSERFFSALPEDRYVKIQYENFVNDPVASFEAIAAMLGMQFDLDAIHRQLSRVSPKSVGKFKTDLSPAEIDYVGQAVSAYVKAEGYQ